MYYNFSNTVILWESYTVIYQFLLIFLSSYITDLSDIRARRIRQIRLDIKVRINV